MKILLISNPFPGVSGGSKRSFEVIKFFHLKNIQCEIIATPQGIKDLLSFRSLYPQNNEIKDFHLDFKEFGIVIHRGSIQFFNEMEKNRNIKIKKIDILSFVNNTFSFIIYPYEIHRYLRNYVKIKDLIDVDAIYSHHESLDAILLSFYLAKMLNKPLIILLQLEPYKRMKDLFKSQNVKNLRSIFNLIPLTILNLYTRFVYSRLIKLSSFKSFLAISNSPISISGLEKINYQVLHPSNAINPKLINFRILPESKEKCAIFYGRIERDKGALDLPYIWKHVMEKVPSAKLFIFGKISVYTNQLLDLANKLGIENSIFVMGYIDPETLFRNIARSRLFINPSHSDSFSLAILESIAVGTPVVTYDIPAIQEIYSNLNPVKLIQEGNITAMAQEIVNIFEMDEDKYRMMIQDKKTDEFIYQYISWEKVADAEIRTLKSIID
jgi:glycosyltransferase involved in cell wall biosynthesis